MKVILLMLTCGLCSPNSSLLQADAPAEGGNFKPTSVTDHRVSIAFTGTVKAIESLGGRKMSVIPVDADPRFAVIVYIESATSGEPPLKEGEEVVLAIHSPARLFRAKEVDVIGNKYRFKLIREEVSKGLRYSQLTADLVEDNEAHRKQLSGGTPCRPLAPEDSAGTPAEIRARPYCSPDEPINCEVALVYLDQLAAKVQRDHDAYLIIVARLGTGERATSLSWNRLGLVKELLADRVPNTNVVTAIGRQVKGYGQLEFYVGGTLLYVLRYKRNLNINCEFG